MARDRSEMAQPSAQLLPGRAAKARQWGVDREGGPQGHEKNVVGAEKQASLSLVAPPRGLRLGRAGTNGRVHLGAGLSRTG